MSTTTAGSQGADLLSPGVQAPQAFVMLTSSHTEPDHQTAVNVVGAAGRFLAASNGHEPGVRKQPASASRRFSVMTARDEPT
jgi:uncharacterized Ntn-hydrolase superfamily protein